MSYCKTLLTLVLIAFLSISATTDKMVTTNAVVVNETSLIEPVTATVSTQHRLNFFERIILKLATKKIKKVDPASADRQAQTSLTFGIASVSLFLVGLLVPFVVFLVIPAGIVAMVSGKHALDKGTQYEAKAKTGRSLGFASLIALAAIVLLAVIVVAAWASNW